mgnify:CR=1 FL=1
MSMKKFNQEIKAYALENGFKEESGFDKDTYSIIYSKITKRGKDDFGSFIALYLDDNIDYFKILSAIQFDVSFAVSTNIYKSDFLEKGSEYLTSEIDNLI